MFDNLNYYRVFYTVANTGNISKAADMLFISQPAISKAISKLEDGLHVKLFLRSSKGVTLTDEGQVLYNHIEKAFSNISQGEDEIRHTLRRAAPRHCGQTALRSKQSERTARRYSAFSGREADRTCSSWTLSCRARTR